MSVEGRVAESADCDEVRRGCGEARPGSKASVAGRDTPTARPRVLLRSTAASESTPAAMSGWSAAGCEFALLPPMTSARAERIT
eukprot:5153603-Pyramimonas_sp.AAC.5